MSWVAEVDGLVGHRSQDVGLHRRVVGFGGEFHGQGEVMLGWDVLGVVEGHPAAEVGQPGGGGEHAATEVFGGEAAP